jgi:NAD(P)-dependent dehydrogenase (short-subunit alcohol dehydrogenase family)
MVVNNAGYGLFGPTIEADLTEVRRQYETNIYGVLAVCQARRLQGGEHIPSSTHTDTPTARRADGDGRRGEHRRRRLT